MSNETAVAVWTPPGPPTKDEWETIRNIATMIAKSEAVPRYCQGKPENAIVAMMTGREVGIPPMLAIQKGYVIDGKYGLESEVMADVVRRNVPGFDFEVVTLNDERCVLKGGVAGKAVHEVEFTFERAKLAGFTEGKYGEKDNWKPGRRADSLFAKALRRLIKMTGGYYAAPQLGAVSDPDEVEPDSPPVEREKSSAAVVDEPTPAPAPTPAPEKPKKVEVGEDWQYRLLAAFAQATRLHSQDYKERLDPPPTKQPGRARWAKANEAELMAAINRYYEERGEKPIKSWGLFPPGDVQNVALWLEAKNGAGNGGADAATGGTDAPPAPETEPEGAPAPPMEEPAANAEQGAPGTEEAPLPDEPAPLRVDPITAKTGEISDGTLDNLLSYFDTLRLATKNGRRFYQRHSTSGSPYLIDAAILKDLGHTKDGQPVAQKLENLWSHEADRIMLARQVAELLLKEVKR